MLNPNIWRSQQQEFSLEGGRISYQDQGSGPVLLLLLHGVPGSSWDWHLLWPMLSGQFRLIAPDFPGCGDSDKPSGQDYRLADQAAAMLALLDSLNINEYQIVAHDYGAAVAWKMLHSTRPPLRMSLLSPRLSSDRQSFLWRERWLAGPSGRLLCQLITEGLYGRYLEHLTGPYVHLTRQRLRDSWQLLTAHQGLQALPQLLNYRYELPLFSELKDELPTISQPMQVIEGRHDPVAGKRHLPDLMNSVTLPAGHYPQLEDPEHLSLLLQEFHALADQPGQTVFENLRKQHP